MTCNVALARTTDRRSLVSEAFARNDGPASGDLRHWSLSSSDYEPLATSMLTFPGMMTFTGPSPG